MIKKKGDRRRNYFIEKRFQSEFIIRFCLLVVLTALISAYVIYFFSLNSVTTVFENSRLVIKPSAEYIMPGLVIGSLVAVVIVGLSTVGVVLFISHRIAGPMYKFKKCLERVSAGDLSFSVHLRNSDEVKQFAESMNTAVRSLNEMVGSVKKASESMGKAIDGIASASDPKDAKKKAAELKEGHAVLKKEIKRFTLE